MKIGILINTAYAKKILTKHKIFAPGPLAASLINGLRKRGHTVVTFAPRGSDLPGPIRGEAYPLVEMEIKNSKMSVLDFVSKRTAKFGRASKEISGQISYRAFQDAQKEKFDVLHVFCSNSTYPNYFTELFSIPTVTTIHSTPEGGPHGDDITFFRFKMFAHQNYISISKNQRNADRSIHYIKNVYNAVDTAKFAFQKKPGSYLIWYGRIMPGKGPHTAIQVALKAKMPLKIACSVPNKKQIPFYKKEIAPYLGKNGIELVGFLSGKKLVNYIQGASAMLFPVTHEEAFGMTIVESMSCGVPVLSFDHGASREIIANGKTGFIVNTPRQLVSALGKLDTIDRATCRAHVEKNFSVDAMTEGYLGAYEQAIQQKKK